MTQKVTGSLEVAVTNIMTPKVNLTFDQYLDLRVSSVLYFLMPTGTSDKGQTFDMTDDHKYQGNTIMRLGSHGAPYFQSV